MKCVFEIRIFWWGCFVSYWEIVKRCCCLNIRWLNENLCQFEFIQIDIQCGENSDLKKKRFSYSMNKFNVKHQLFP